jgi:TolC family type I secretion outer membrane protein
MVWRRATRISGPAFISLALSTLGGCSLVKPNVFGGPGTSAGPATAWQPTSDWKIPPKPPTPPTIPEMPDGITLDDLKSGKPLALADVVAVALQNNLTVRDAWLQAQAQAEVVGVARSSYLPNVSLNVPLQYSNRQFTAAFPIEQTTVAPAIDLNWTLLDIGGRASRVRGALQTLAASNWTHNAAIQNVVLQVEQAYVQYLNAKALLDVQKATVDTAKVSLDAAQIREKAGLATVADVLQAKTALSQAELSYVSIAGQIYTVAGALATAMGLPANLAVGVGLLPEDVPLQEVTRDVESYIQQAVEYRPDLAAARSRAEATAARVSEIRSDFYPTISISAGYGRIYFIRPDAQPGANALAGITLNVPIFNGLTTVYSVRQAEVSARDAQVQVENLEQQIVLQVWSSYYALKTASQQLTSARDLVASAVQSQDVALGRYKAGVGNILDLLAAQNSLANARAQEVQARSGWFLALAQLAHDTGILRLPEKGNPVPGILENKAP